MSSLILYSIHSPWSPPKGLIITFLGGGEIKKNKNLNSQIPSVSPNPYPWTRTYAIQHFFFLFFFFLLFFFLLSFVLRGFSLPLLWRLGYVLYRAVPCHAMPCHAMPYRACAVLHYKSAIMRYWHKSRNLTRSVFGLRKGKLILSKEGRKEGWMDG